MQHALHIFEMNGGPQLSWSKEGLLPVQGIRLCVCDQEAYVDNLADTVDQLLFLICAEAKINIFMQTFKIKCKM